MVSGDFDTRFSLKNMFKDVQLAISAADEKPGTSSSRRFRRHRHGWYRAGMG